MIGVVTRVFDTMVGEVATKLAASLVARIEPLVVEIVERHLGERVSGVRGGVASWEEPVDPATDPMHGAPDAPSREETSLDTVCNPTLRSSGVGGVQGSAAEKSAL